VRTADIVPTLLDYLGFEPAEVCDGTTLRGLVEGGAEEPRSAYADQINDYDMNAAMKEQRPDAKFLSPAVGATAVRARRRGVRGHPRDARIAALHGQRTGRQRPGVDVPAPSGRSAPRTARRG